MKKLSNLVLFELESRKLSGRQMKSVRGGYFLSAVCLFVACLSCEERHAKESPSDIASMIYVDVTTDQLQPREYPLDKAVSALEYIPLETTENCLINRVSDVFVIGDNLLVSDFFNLYMFDRQGKFIRPISRKGGGPADYVYVNTVIVDPDSRVFYLVTYKKILKFTFDGTFIETVGMNESEQSSCGIMTPDRTFMFYKANNNVFIGDTSTVLSLFETDTLGRVLRTYPNPSPRYVERRRNYLSTSRPLYVHDGNIHFNEFGNDTLFALSGDTMSARLVVDLGNLKMDHNPDLSHLTPLEGLAFINAVKKLDFSSVWEDDNFYYIRIGISQGVNGNYHCIYDKHANEFICLGDGFTNTLDGGIRFFPQPGKVLPDGTKLMWKEAEDFKEEILSPDYMVQKEKYGDRFEKVYQLAQSLQEDDNPVLILGK
jgi:natural product precursor